VNENAETNRGACIKKMTHHHIVQRKKGGPNCLGPNKREDSSRGVHPITTCQADIFQTKINFNPARGGCKGSSPRSEEPENHKGRPKRDSNKPNLPCLRNPWETQEGEKLGRQHQKLQSRSATNEDAIDSRAKQKSREAPTAA